MNLRSYPKVYNLGHAAVQDLLKHTIIIQEKVDGSQFSFGVHNGELHIRSKDAIIEPTAPPKMFKDAVDTVNRLHQEGKLEEGVTYRGEAFMKPKHNALAYDRVPNGHIMLFDVDTGDEAYSVALAAQAGLLGLESVPQLWSGEGQFFNYDRFKELLETVSVLGGQKIEGVVVKAYGVFGKDGKTLMGKYVSEAYKEVQSGEWRKQNPTKGDIIAEIGLDLATPARWEKAIQHLRDRGELQNAPQDIGPLLKEIATDVLAEEGEAIKERLMKYAWKHIQRRILMGFPQWYKDRLAKSQFETPDAVV